MIVTDETRDACRDTSTADLTPDELRTLARRERHESGGRQTGKELAAMFGTSAQWGQDQAAAGCAEAVERGTPAVAAAAVERPAAPAAARPISMPPAVPRHVAPAWHAARGKTPAGASETVQRVTAAAVALVAAGAAAASCSHMHAQALEPGEGAMARALPLSVGRLVAAWPPVALASSIGLLLRQTRGER